MDRNQRTALAAKQAKAEAYLATLDPKTPEALDWRREVRLAKAMKKAPAAVVAKYLAQEGLAR